MRTMVGRVRAADKIQVVALGDSRSRGGVVAPELGLKSGVVNVNFLINNTYCYTATINIEFAPHLICPDELEVFFYLSGICRCGPKRSKKQGLLDRILYDCPVLG